MIGDYLQKIKEPYLYRAGILFIFAFILGLVSAYSDPEMVHALIEATNEWIEPIRELSGFELFITIVVNNGVKIFLAAVLGIIFGIAPFLFVLSNGMVLGTISYLHIAENGILPWLVGLWPHGIFEIPALIVAGAVGLMLGSKAYKKIFNGGDINLKQELKESSRFLFRVIIPVIILAAFIETFITLPLFNSLG